MGGEAKFYFFRSCLFPSIGKLPHKSQIYDPNITLKCYEIACHKILKLVKITHYPLALFAKWQLVHTIYNLSFLLVESLSFRHQPQKFSPFINLEEEDT